MSLKDNIKKLQAYYKNAGRAAWLIVEWGIKLKAGVAATFAGLSAMLPIVDVPAYVLGCGYEIFTIYCNICLALHVPLKWSVIKVLSKEAVKKIAYGLPVVLINTVNPLDGITAASLAFATVYTSGAMFIELLLKLAERGSVGADVAKLSAEELKALLDESSVEDMCKEAVEECKAKESEASA